MMVVRAALALGALALLGSCPGCSAAQDGLLSYLVGPLNDTTVPDVNWSAIVRPPVGNDSCNTTNQLAALIVLFLDTKGWHWNNNSNWLTNNTCMQPSVANSSVMVPLPVQCCWHGVYCCTDPVCPPDDRSQRNCNCDEVGAVTAIRLDHNNMTGTWPENLLTWLACDLKGVDLAFNELRGTMSDQASSLSKLQLLALGYNQLSGTLPDTIARLTRLAILDLTSNNLTGSVPSTFCSGLNSSLTDLLLPNNKFSGGFNAKGCANLVQLDLTGNQFSESFPDFEDFMNLRILRMSNNKFEGDIPSLDFAPWLTNIDIARNRLRGSIPEDVTALRLLAQLRVGGNQVTGMLPAQLFSNLGILTRISAPDNFLHGTIPDTPIQVSTVVEVDLSNNTLTGTIPEAFSKFAHVNTTVSLQLNYLSCCGVDPIDIRTIDPADRKCLYVDQVYRTIDKSKPILPPYLRQSTFQAPVRARSQCVDSQMSQEVAVMRCPALRTVAGSADSADNLLEWNIDPAYYLYRGCECDQGYDLVNLNDDDKLPRYICRKSRTLAAWILVVAIVGGCCLAWFLFFLLCYRVGMRLTVLQHLDNAKKRLMGEPREGIIAVVTTDIEGYSDLMKREPELMGKALRLPNGCIDRARWTNFGFTMEQEGDSFTIVFHSPFDAAVFCLQSQQLLNGVEWPERLLNAEGGAERRGKASMLSRLQGAARSMFLTRGDRVSSLRSRGNSVETPANSPAGSMLTPGHSPLAPQLVSALARAANSPFGSTHPRGRAGSITNALRAFARHTGGSMSSARAPAIPEEMAGPSSGTDGGSPGRNSSATSAAPPPMGEPQLPRGSSDLRVASSVGGRSDRSVLTGLRVRMGIVTGRLERGMSLRSLPLMDRAKVVSDAAAGGQVLMDKATFDSIKERLVELGQVDDRGFSLAKMNAGKPIILAHWLGLAKRSNPAEAAVVLDMGRYKHSSVWSKAAGVNNLVPQPPTPRAHRLRLPFQLQSMRRGGGAEWHLGNRPRSGAGATSESIEPDKDKDTDKDKDRDRELQAPATPTSVVASADTGFTEIHLYQILSPMYVERARIFGSKLALKDDWVCIDVPYFKAPGAAMAGLGLESSVTIPAITMVFSAMEGVKDWKLSSVERGQRRAVQRLIRDVFTRTLMASPGGYLCRIQEDEFKYMVAFPTPEDALLWQDWPEWFLKNERLREERDDEGSIIWRGPRLRMGLCHGRPQAIVPDHMGRADYHGACINSAARYMDAAAHGGQVVCEEATALAVIANFNAAARTRRLVASGALVAVEETSSHPATTTAATSPFQTGSGFPGLAVDRSAGSGPTPSGPSAAAKSLDWTTPFGATEVSARFNLPSFDTGEAAPRDGAAGGSATAPPPRSSLRLPANNASIHPPPPTPSLTPAAAQEPPEDEGPFGMLPLPPDRSASSSPPLLAPVPHPLQKPPTGKGFAGDDGANGLRLIGLQGLSAIEEADGPGLSPVDEEGSRPGPSDASVSTIRTASTTSTYAPDARGTHSTITFIPLVSGGTIVGGSGTPVASPRRSPLMMGGADKAALDSPRLEHVGLEAGRGEISTRTPRDGDADGTPPTSNALQQPAAAHNVAAGAASRTPAMRIASANPVAPNATSRLSRMADATAATSVSAPSLAQPERLHRPGRPAMHVVIPPVDLSNLPSGTIITSSGVGMSAAHVQQLGATTSAALGAASGPPPSFTVGFTAWRLGAFRFKGSPEGISMVLLLLDSQGGRKFPAEPPKGKGGRVAEMSGLLGVVPELELPDVSRQYYSAWRARQESGPATPSQPAPPPPSSTNRIKGWAINIIATRSTSLDAPAGRVTRSGRSSAEPTSSGAPDDTPAPPPYRGDVTASSTRPPGEVPSMPTIRARGGFLGLMRVPSLRGSTAGVPSRRSLQTRSEFNLNNLVMYRNPAARPRSVLTTVGDVSDSDRDPAQAAVHTRSDSLSSFIVAAEQGLMTAAAQHATGAVDGSSSTGTRSPAAMEGSPASDRDNGDGRSPARRNSAAVLQSGDVEMSARDPGPSVGPGAV